MNGRIDRGRKEPEKQIRDMTEPELRDFTNNLARLVEKELPTGSGFALLFFDETQISQYVCNCPRTSMIKVLRETADRIELRQDVRRT